MCRLTKVGKRLAVVLSICASVIETTAAKTAEDTTSEMKLMEKYLRTISKLDEVEMFIVDLGAIINNHGTHRDGGSSNGGSSGGLGLGNSEKSTASGGLTTLGGGGSRSVVE